MAYHAEVHHAHTAEQPPVSSHAKQHKNKKNNVHKTTMSLKKSVSKSNTQKSTLVKSNTINIKTFSKKLASVSARTSSQKCAKSIRVALQSAGARIVNHPVAASDWGKTLTDIGYKKIDPSFNNPAPGDIYIIQRTKAHVYGHIAGFTGSEWVSDFKQSGYAVYKENVKYSYYRLGS